MDREHITPPGMFKHPGFTRVVTVSGPMKLVFVAGQTAGDEKTNKCVGPGDYRAQYLYIMQKLEQQLTAAGATWDDVVYRRTFVRDIDEFFKARTDPTVPKFGNLQPPGTLVAISRLTDPEFLIEIDLLAIVPG